MGGHFSIIMFHVSSRMLLRTCLYSPVKHGWTYRGKAFPVSASRLRNFAGGHPGGRSSVN